MRLLHLLGCMPWCRRDRETRRLYALKVQQRPLPANTVELTYNEITVGGRAGQGLVVMCHAEI